MLDLLLPVALLGLAVNADPGQVVVLTLLLGGRHPRRDASAFLAGWAMSLTVCFVAARGLVRLLPNRVGSIEGTIIAVLEILLATVLAWFAIHEWRRRSRPPVADAPRVLRRLHNVGPRIAFAAGIFEQPWTLTIAAGMVVVRSQATATETIVAGVVFAATSALSLVAALTYFARRGPSAVARLREIERRVTSAGPAVIAVAAAIAAVAFLADGVHSLLTP
jgi:threonine/homoserine/homoserine lactone efflux protein